MFGTTKFKIQKEQGYEYLKISKGDKDCNTLVLLHGMFGGLSNFDPLVKHIEDCTVFVPAIPIYDFDRAELSIHGLTQWLHGFCESQKISSPILLGNSLGGHLAIDYAVHYPREIAALVLTGSSGLQEKGFGSSWPRRNDREYIRKQAAQTFYEDLIDEVILDDIMEVISTPSKLKKMLVIARDTHDYNMEKHLSEIHHDVLLVWGKNDVITPPEVAREFLEKLPNASLQWIDKCGHAPMMEHPRKFAHLLNEFLTAQQNKRKNKSISDYEKNYSHF